MARRHPARHGAKPVGEGRLNALVAAERGIPVVLVTGDDRACAEAAGYAPEAERVVVKQCVSRYAARCSPPAHTAAAIRAAAQRAAGLAIRRAGGDAPVYQVRVEVDAAQLALAAALVPGVRRTGDRSVSYASPTAQEMIRCFKVVCTMIAAGMEDRYG